MMCFLFVSLIYSIDFTFPIFFFLQERFIAEEGMEKLYYKICIVAYNWCRKEMYPPGASGPYRRLHLFAGYYIVNEIKKDQKMDIIMSM
jgi:hypothetical protein